MKLEDLLYVLEHLSAQNASELETLCLSPWEITKRIRGFVKDGGAAFTGVYEGRPVFVFGLIFENENSSWFLATAEYFGLGAKAIGHARNFLREMKKRYGSFVSGSCSRHPDVDRWFKVLGYEKIGENEGVKWFRYR